MGSGIASLTRRSCRGLILPKTSPPDSNNNNNNTELEKPVHTQ